jgi:hypothetical protein
VLFTATTCSALGEGLSLATVSIDSATTSTTVSAVGQVITGEMKSADDHPPTFSVATPYQPSISDTSSTHSPACNVPSNSAATSGDERTLSTAVVTTPHTPEGAGVVSLSAGVVVGSQKRAPAPFVIHATNTLLSPHLPPVFQASKRFKMMGNHPKHESSNTDNCKSVITGKRKNVSMINSCRLAAYQLSFFTEISKHRNEEI